MEILHIDGLERLYLGRAVENHIELSVNQHVQISHDIIHESLAL